MPNKYCNKSVPYVNLLGYLEHLHIIYYNSEAFLIDMITSIYLTSSMCLFKLL